MIDQGLVDLGCPGVATDPLPTHDTRVVPPPPGGVHLIEFSRDEIFMIGWDGEAPQLISLYEESDFVGYIPRQQIPRPFSLITALVQLTFFRLNSYFVVRREQSANRLASNEEYTPYVDAKIKANVVKAGSHEIVLYDHIRGHFHVKTNKGTKSSSTGGRTYHINLQEYACTCGKTLIYGFPCSHILVACHFRSVDFKPLV